MNIISFKYINPFLDIIKNSVAMSYSDLYFEDCHADRVEPVYGYPVSSHSRNCMEYPELDMLCLLLCDDVLSLIMCDETPQQTNVAYDDDECDDQDSALYALADFLEWRVSSHSARRGGRWL